MSKKLVVPHVFALSRLITSIGLKDELKGIVNKKISGTQKEIEEKGIEIVYTIFEKATNEVAERKLYEFLSLILEKQPAEIMEMGPQELIDEMLETANIEEWKSFLSQVAKLMGLKS